MYSGDFLLPANYTAGVMPDPKSKFDVRGDSFLAHCKHTIVFAAYVLQTFLAWVFLGGWAAGRMLAFNLNRLPGSYFRLTSRRRR